MLNKVETLSVAEWRRAEALKIAIMGRKGLGIDKPEGNNPADFDGVMADARYIEGWLSTAEADELKYGGSAGGEMISYAGITLEQLNYLREILPSFRGLGPLDLIREYYRKVALGSEAGNVVSLLPLVADIANPEQDQLAISDGGLVMRYNCFSWIIVDEFPGYRLVGGNGTISRPHRIYWAPGVWPPVTEEAASVGEGVA
jgi:hypothetical protein